MKCIKWSPLRCSALAPDRTAAIRVESHAFGTATIFTPPAVHNITSSRPQRFPKSPLHSPSCSKYHLFTPPEVHNITSSYPPAVHNITSSQAPGIDNITSSRPQRFTISSLHSPSCSQYHLFSRKTQGGGIISHYV